MGVISPQAMLVKRILSCCFLTEPSASPANITANAVNSTSILVSWGQVPLLDQNGVIVSYTIAYTSLRSGSEETKNVTAPANQATLTGLNEHTVYMITVFASTAKGGGIESTPIAIITEEDSKFVNAGFFHKFCFLVMFRLWPLPNGFRGEGRVMCECDVLFCYMH